MASGSGSETSREESRALALPGQAPKPARCSAPRKDSPRLKCAVSGRMTANPGRRAHRRHADTAGVRRPSRPRCRLPDGFEPRARPRSSGEGVFAYDRPDRIVDLDQGLDAAPNPGEFAFVQVLHLAVLYLVPALENAHQLR